MTSVAKTTLRYLRHIDLPQIGFEGQEKIAAGAVALVGMGGLGAAAAPYLAGAGARRLILIDDDRVEESNLQRQIIYSMDDIGAFKVDATQKRLERLNPYVAVTAHKTRLDACNAKTLLQDADIILDCSDNFATRFLLNATCIDLEKPLVSASVQGFAGQVLVLRPRHACYRCVFPETPPEGMVPTCPEAGVFGPIVGMMGVLQAGEALKELAGLNPAASYMVRFDCLSLKSERLEAEKDPSCHDCGGLRRGAKALQSAP